MPGYGCRSTAGRRASTSPPRGRGACMLQPERCVRRLPGQGAPRCGVFRPRRRRAAQLTGADRRAPPSPAGCGRAARHLEVCPSPSPDAASPTPVRTLTPALRRRFMTYRNDPYDPKQVALLDPAALAEAQAAAEQAFAAATNPD